MTTKVDGTNGVLQSYDYQVLTTGFSYTFAAGTTTLIANPAGTLATGTVTMPAAPGDGMVVTIESTQQITALTVAANTGQSLVGGTVTLRANQPLSFIYRLSNTTWYLSAGASNSQLVAGTAVASTSGTSIDFTGIPSWVKRITIQFAGVSTSGTTAFKVQLGTGSTPTWTTSGYVSYGVSAGVSAVAGAVDATGLVIGNASAAANTYGGNMTLSLVGSNSWCANAAVFGQTTGSGGMFGGGSITLAATLTAVRITTGNGTDTFDAGSINILYE